MTAPVCIYFGEKPFWIASQWTPALTQLSNNTDSLSLENPNRDQIKQAIDDLDAGNAKAVIIVDNEDNRAWKKFSETFSFMEAGGGLVKNENGEYLFIMRRGFWDLPKGKLDDGEAIEACALREVVEETGLQLVEMGDHLCDTYHVYHERGKFMLKKSVWYRMNATSVQGLVPQTEEQIESIEWLAPAETAKVLANTFPSIKDVLIASGDF